MTEPYDWQAPEIQEHWAGVRAKIASGLPVGIERAPDADLKSARKQLAICERDAEEWRDVIAKMEKDQAND